MPGLQAVSGSRYNKCVCTAEAMTDACIRDRSFDNTDVGCNRDDACAQCNLDVFFRAPPPSVTLTDTQVLSLLADAFGADKALRCDVAYHIPVHQPVRIL